MPDRHRIPTRMAGGKNAVRSRAHVSVSRSVAALRPMPNDMGMGIWGDPTGTGRRAPPSSPAVQPRRAAPRRLPYTHPDDEPAPRSSPVGPARCDRGGPPPVGQVEGRPGRRLDATVGFGWPGLDAKVGFGRRGVGFVRFVGFERIFDRPCPHPAARHHRHSGRRPAGPDAGPRGARAWLWRGGAGPRRPLPRRRHRRPRGGGRLRRRDRRHAPGPLRRRRDVRAGARRAGGGGRRGRDRPPGPARTSRAQGHAGSAGGARVPGGNRRAGGAPPDRDRPGQPRDGGLPAGPAAAAEGGHRRVRRAEPGAHRGRRGAGQRHRPPGPPRRGAAAPGEGAPVRVRAVRGGRACRRRDRGGIPAGPKPARPRDPRGECRTGAHPRRRGGACAGPGDPHRRGAGHGGRDDGRAVPAGGWLPGGQRVGAAGAQQRPLDDRGRRHVAVRAAHPRDLWAAVGERSAAFRGGDGEPAGHGTAPRGAAGGDPGGAGHARRPPARLR